jgi:UDP-N-acetylglucosamine 2-epimerase (non-hydrolysing)
MERPEAQDSAAIILAGIDEDIVLQSIEMAIYEDKNKGNDDIPVEYKITNTSKRVLKLIMGNTKLSNKWWGIQ